MTGPLWFLGLSGLHLLIWLPFSSYVVLLPLIGPEWGMSNGQSGLVFSTYLVGSAIASLTVVPATDRVQPHNILIAGAVMVAGSHLLFPFVASGVLTASVLRVIGGAGQICVYIPAIRLISSGAVHARRGRAVGMFVAAAYAGSSLSYLATGALLDILGDWRRTYAAMAWVACVAAVLLILMLRSRHAPADATSGRGRGTFQWRVLSDRRLRMVTVAYALHTAELYLARLWLPLLLAAALARGVTPRAEVAAEAAILSGAMFALGIGGAYLGGHLSDRLGRGRSGMLIFATSGLSSAMIGWLVDGPLVLVVALGFVLGIATAADSAIYTTAVVELAPRAMIGSAQAMQSAIGFGVGSLAPVLAGVLLDATRDAQPWGAAFSLNALLALAGIGALWALHRELGAPTRSGDRSPNRR